jgi:hypothetical protein
LAVIAGGVYLQGARSPVARRGPGVSNTSSLTASYLPGDLTPFGREQTFDSETLSDAIDGKADLYLSTGFVKLSVSRFAKKADAKSWIELSVYQMREAADAFSVYSLQKRKGSRPLNLDSAESGARPGGSVAAYRTADALFFAAGPRYYEITSSSPGLMGDMEILAKNLVKAQPQSGGFRTQSLFPPESLDRSTISLHMKDVFAYSGLDRVYTAVYTDRGCQVTAFISRRKSPKEAAQLAAAYGKFLLENGGTAAGQIAEAPGSKIYKVFDTYEVVLSRGPFFAGSHEVDKLESAKDVALRVYRKLGEAVR